MENASKSCAVDSLLNFETVKYFNNENFEVSRYEKLIQKYQKTEWINTALLCLMNVTQNATIMIGIISGCVYCIYQILQRDLSVGDFVLFVAYLQQLYGPLSFMGTYYRLIQNCFIDMENMFELLFEAPEEEVSPNYKDLRVEEGKIEFQNVSFSYNNKKDVLKSLSFTIQPGNTLAIVGPSGSGKTTITRLMFRFYNIESGTILIDGQDISTVTLKSLRESIGVVPQDTVLFNESIFYNVNYGKVDAKEEDVRTATVAAHLHEAILSFPSSFNTVVGERGLKLSGGEKQRVAIARTFLKDPKILILDEATSSLDTATERNIQKSLDQICKDRTNIIIAHRLSTVVHADEIIVLNDGCIVERGNHHNLIEQNGLYKSMWEQQLLDVPNDIE